MSVVIRLENGDEVDVRAALIAAMGDDKDQNRWLSEALDLLIWGARQAARRREGR